MENRLQTHFLSLSRREIFLNTSSHSQKKTSEHSKWKTRDVVEFHRQEMLTSCWVESNTLLVGAEYSELNIVFNMLTIRVCWWCAGQTTKGYQTTTSSSRKTYYNISVCFCQAFHWHQLQFNKWPFCSVLHFRYINSKQNVCHFLLIFNSDNIISNEDSVLYSISGVFILKIGDGQGQNIIYERPSMYSIPVPVHSI